MGRLEEASQEYSASIGLIEQLRQGSSQPELRASYLEAKRCVYFEAVDCCLEQGDYAAALEYVERLKSRTLAEMLYGRQILPRNASKHALEEYHVLRIRMRAASQRLSEQEGTPQNDGLLKGFLDAKEAYQSVISNLRKADPNFDPEQDLRLSYPEIRALIPDAATAIIELFPMQDKTVAFLILQDREISTSTIFIRDYALDDAMLDMEESRDRAKLESVLRRLYLRLFEPIESHLPGIRRIVFIPYSGLHLLPLHAMFSERDGSKKYLTDDYLITYAPSAKILRLCLSAARTSNLEGCVAWANPRKDLPFARKEAEAIAAVQGWRILPAVTRERLIERSRTAGFIHYSGHANGSALLFHGSDDPSMEEPYDTGDIFVSLDVPQASLVTLSACDTGKVKLGMTDEYFGLPSAFLHAGASTVICSLWPVSDISTTLLMARMYKLMNEGLGKAESLWKAQLWLKNPENRSEHVHELEKLLPWLGPRAGKPLQDTPRFGRTRLSAETFLPQNLSHPYYWAGFICTGAP